MNWGQLGILIWPIVKEAFKGRFSYSTYLRRNRLVTLLMMIILVLFTSFSYMSEQAIAHGAKSKAKDEIIKHLQQDIANCKKRV